MYKFIHEITEPMYKIRYKDLNANIIEDGRSFCGWSFNKEWCCIGVILGDPEEDNPMLQVNTIFRRVERI